MGSNRNRNRECCNKNSLSVRVHPVVFIGVLIVIYVSTMQPAFAIDSPDVIYLSPHSDTTRGFSVGPRLGVNVSRLRDLTDLRGFFNMPFNETTRTSFTGGAALEYRLSSWFSLQTELVIIKRGGDEVIFQGPDSSIHLTYTSLPVLARFVMGRPSSWYAFSFLIGPELSILWDSKIRAVGSPVWSDLDSMKKYGIGLTVGFEMQIKVGRNKIYVGNRATLGLRDLIKDSEKDNYGGGSLFSSNQALSVTAFVKL